MMLEVGSLVHADDALLMDLGRLWLPFRPDDVAIVKNP